MADEERANSLAAFAYKHASFIIAALAGLVVFLLLTSREVSAGNILFGWNVSAGVFVALSWRKMLRATVESIRKRSADLDFSDTVLLALSIALIPTLPLLGLYLPLRWAWTNDARAVRRALKRAPTDPLLVEFLARRAVSNFPYDKLLAVSPQPFKDLEEGRYDSLAGLELDRLGIRNGSA